MAERLIFEKATGDERESFKLRGLVRVGNMFALAVTGRGTFHDALTAIADACVADHVIVLRYSETASKVDVVATLTDGASMLSPQIAIEVCASPVGHMVEIAAHNRRFVGFVIGQSSKGTDFVLMSTKDHTTASVLAGELPIIWANRSNHVAEAQLYGEQSDRGVLSPENPYDLTRAEIQVCLCLADGLKPLQMTERLNCSMATVRTHLRHIYSKTELDGMVSVVHRLNNDAQQNGLRPK